MMISHFTSGKKNDDLPWDHHFFSFAHFFIGACAWWWPLPVRVWKSCGVWECVRVCEATFPQQKNPLFWLIPLGAWRFHFFLSEGRKKWWSHSEFKKRKKKNDDPTRIEEKGKKWWSHTELKKRRKKMCWDHHFFSPKKQKKISTDSKGHYPLRIFSKIESLEVPEAYHTRPAEKNVAAAFLAEFWKCDIIIFFSLMVIKSEQEKKGTIALFCPKGKKKGLFQQQKITSRVFTLKIFQKNQHEEKKCFFWKSKFWNKKVNILHFLSWKCAKIEGKKERAILVRIVLFFPFVQNSSFFFPPSE